MCQFTTGVDGISCVFGLVSTEIDDSALFTRTQIQMRAHTHTIKHARTYTMGIFPVVIVLFSGFRTLPRFDSTHIALFIRVHFDDVEGVFIVGI